MSKDFQQEYKEYLNAQAPDLWQRIEAGIEGVPAGGSGEDNIVPFGVGSRKNTKKNGKKKKQVRYQHYRAIVSAAACLFAILMIIPVYLLVKPAGKDSAPAEAADEMVLTDATITNTVEESGEEMSIEGSISEEAAMEDSAPEEEMMYSVTEEGTLAEVESEVPFDGLAEESAPQEEDVDKLSAVGLNGETVGTGTGGSKEDVVLEEKVLDVQIATEEGRQESGMLYTAAVVGGTEVVSFVVPDDSGIVLQVGGTYCLTLQQYVEEGYFVVVSAAVQ